LSWLYLWRNTVSIAPRRPSPAYVISAGDDSRRERSRFIPRFACFKLFPDRIVVPPFERMESRFGASELRGRYDLLPRFRIRIIERHRAGIKITEATAGDARDL
jgi:hypothetical protein